MAIASLTRSGISDRETGMSRTVVLIWILILVSGLYAGFQLVPFFYYEQEIQSLMEAQASKASVLPDRKIRKTLLKKIRQLELPINSEEDLKINRFDDKIIIELEYDEVLYVDFGEDRSYDLWVFHMHPRVERRY